MGDLYPLNQIFSKPIEKVDSYLIPPRRTDDIRQARMKQETVSRWLDKLGQQSSIAQGLNKTITTGDKLRTAEDQQVYIMFDKDGDTGKGEIVGYLRMGPKSLYLHNSKQETVQVKPMCVLDFFVLPERQRHGYGKQLFDYMLRDLNLAPNQLAIDGPSPKLISFMKKHYGIGNLIKQHNNFAVTPEFFNEARDTPVGPAAPVSAVGRFTARKPSSFIGNVIHGGHDKPTPKAIHEEPQWLETPERPKTLPLEAPVEEPVQLETQQKELPIEPYPEVQEAMETLAVETDAVSVSPAGSLSRRDAQLTDQGYFDIKFYHSKLW